ncbi:unnamed protein product [Gongylonema pulchrum]|uniref:Transposase n=1 Tax=Gongylonema pulchrum TaxID=637853 RepID=A0A183DXC8_9BILA|nr:unnamed protein product [Gongylonema pulchrum]
MQLTFSVVSELADGELAMASDFQLSDAMSAIGLFCGYYTGIHTVEDAGAVKLLRLYADTPDPSSDCVMHAVLMRLSVASCPLSRQKMQH